MATIRDIANRLGIAPSTVSKGLNGASDISNELRQVVLDTAIEMGYVTKRMKKEEHKKLALFVENMEYANPEDFGYDLILGFRQAALRDHWDVDVVPMNASVQSEERYDSYMLRNGYSGSFLLGFTLHDDWMKQLSNTRIPTVLLDNYIDKNAHVAYVGTDSYEGIDLAIEHLKLLGHKRIAFLNGEPNSMVSAHRHQAFLDSMRANRLEVFPELIAFGYYVSDCAKYHVPNFLAKGATAIVCGSDLIAYGVIEECKARGYKVPDDISVIGFDDLPSAAYFDPPLTTIRQDRLDLGKDSYAALSWLLNNVSISKSLLRAELVVRSSTAQVGNNN